MSLFVIADLHLSFGVDKPMDVFPGWSDYTERLEKNWRAVVSEEDTVVIAGDISWGMKLEETLEDFRYIHALPGRKILLKGNHDYWWSTKSKIAQFLTYNGLDRIEILQNNAFSVEDRTLCGTRGWLCNAQTPEDIKILNRETVRLRLSLEEGKKLGAEPVVFLHYPPIYDGMESRPILELLLEYGVKDCYFGHIHGRHAAKKAPTGEYKGIRMHLVACDYVDFCPVLVR